MFELMLQRRSDEEFELMHRSNDLADCRSFLDLLGLDPEMAGMAWEIRKDGAALEAGEL